MDMKKKEILEELYNNYMNSTSNAFVDREKPDYLNIQKIFPKDKYHRIFIEVRESDDDLFVFKEYGYLSTKNNDFIIYCCLSTNNKTRDFLKIKTFKKIEDNDRKKIPNIVINHYKKMPIKVDCDYLALNSNYKWDLNIFSTLLKKNLKKRKEFFDNSGVFYNDQKKYSDLDISTDPSVRDLSGMHPDIIIYYFNKSGKFTPIKKIKPSK